jgi:SAM-dependent methyltransferase
MAREFPEADVLGVDLAPVPAEPENLPNNCRFEVDDINLGYVSPLPSQSCTNLPSHPPERMGHLAGQYDLIHIRLVGSGLKDIQKSMSDVERCLKPGGLVLWLDIDYDLYSRPRATESNGRSESTFIYKPVASELNPGGAWLQRPIYGILNLIYIGCYPN